MVIDYKRILVQLIKLCWFSLILCFILKIFTPISFEIVVLNARFIAITDLLVKLNVHHLIYYLMHIFSLSLYYLAIMRQFKFSKKQFILMILYATVTFCVKWFYPVAGFVVDVAFTFTIIPFFLSKSIVITVDALVLNAIFQGLSIISRNINLHIISADNLILQLVMMIDVYIMLLLFYLYMNLYKEEKYTWLLYLVYGYLKKLTNLKHFLEHYLATSKENLHRLFHVCAKKQNRKMYLLIAKFKLFKAKYYSLIFISFIGFALIFGKEIEAILMFLSYKNTRYLFPKTFHHKNFYKCVYYSICMMIIATYASLPVDVSFVFPVLIAFCVGFILCYIQDYIDLRNNSDTKANKLDGFALYSKTSKYSLLDDFVKNNPNNSDIIAYSDYLKGYDKFMYDLFQLRFLEFKTWKQIKDELDFYDTKELSSCLSVMYETLAYILKL